jgi:hypothetical protein
MPIRPAASRVLSTRFALLLTAVAVAALALPAISAATPKPAVLTLNTVKVGAPGNPAVAIQPFTDALYRSCGEVPSSEKECLMVGGVKYGYGIGQLEITVKQWVDFLNTVDPSGTDPHHLWAESESSTAWPKYGQIDFAASVGKGRHYAVASPEWADKPYGFANFLRAARFINSLYNGKVLTKTTSSAGAFDYVTYRVRLSRQTETGMYKMAGNRAKGATRAHKTGFVLPSQNEWIKAAYYEPNGGGTYSYWKYPTNPGVFGQGQADGPKTTTLNPKNGDVTNAGTQPLATFRAEGAEVPSWCPPLYSAEACATKNPFGMPPLAYEKAFQGSLSTVGQALTTSPWGTLDQGGNAVEWTDTIAPAPTGSGKGKVWRRLHGGIANSTAYQLWISAVGLQPQDNSFGTATYPWLGFRIGVLGDLKVGKQR